MAKGDQINFKPHFKKEGSTLPCDGEVGDIYVFSPLDEKENDPSTQGLASVWFCIKGADREGRNCVWARVQFDGIVSCEMEPATPPQNHPILKRG